VTAPMPPRDPAERATLQRERILRAARRCFVRRGFHAASMADIADTAEMSPGLIYRYFPSKNAIVHAIVDRQMEEARRVLDELSSAADLVSAILAEFERWSRGDDDEMNAALFLEMIAVSTRDAELAAAMGRAEVAIRARLAEMLARTHGGAERTDWSERAMLLQCLLEGLLVRAIRQPDLDRRLLREALDRALLALRDWPAVGGAADGSAAPRQRAR
jgi:AcrR family transcriptional regulator